MIRSRQGVREYQVTRAPTPSQSLSPVRGEDWVFQPDAPPQLIIMPKIQIIYSCISTTDPTQRRLAANLAMDPLSTTLSGVTAAIQATKLLKNTVTRFKDRDKTLARLQDVVEDLSNILDVLRGTVDSGVSTALLEGPVSRCNQVCRDFATAMQAFGGKSKMGFRDWTKMEFMKGDINEFMDTLAGYKATISVGLGTITMLVPFILSA